MKSLLIQAFPRSLSTLTMHILKESFGSRINYPEWRSGEVLHKGHPDILVAKAHTPNLEDFAIYENVLHQYKEDYIIKDVNQPFMCKTYLDKYPDSYNVLYIQRPLADNIFCMFKNGWWWPMNILGLELPPDMEHFVPDNRHFSKSLPLLVDAIIHIDKTCYRNIKEKISYNNLIENPDILFSRIRALGYELDNIDYINSEFLSYRETVLSYRQEPVWHVINGMLRERLNDYKTPR